MLYLEKTVAESLTLLKIIVPSMLAGMIIASSIYSLPQFRRVSDKISALASFANLRSGIAVTAFFAHKVTALSILADMHRKELIEGKEVIIASIVGMFPMSFRIVLLMLTPLSISVLGLKLGVIYTSLELLSRFLVALIGVYLGRKYLSGGSISYSNENSIENCMLETFRQFFRVLLVLVPTIFIVTLFLNSVNSLTSALNVYTPQLAIIITGTGSSIAGIGVAGSLLVRGEIDERIALISLMVASAFHRIIESLRNSMPVSISLFGFSFGVKLTVVLLLMSELACFLAISALLILFAAGII